MTHTFFATARRGLRRESPPMVLFEKAKRIGIWNPSEIDLTQDKADWPTFSENDREAFLQLIALFQAGEEAVTLDLLPLIQVIAEQGRIEEEMYLTSFLWEEAKHTDFFNRFLVEIAGETTNLERFHLPSYKHIFYDALPSALHRLKADPSPEALVRASTTYNLVVEGIIAETGYYAFSRALDERKLLPGTRLGVGKIKQDEARHIAYGIFLLSHLMAEQPALWDVVQETMNELLVPVMGLIHELYASYEIPPFGVDEDVFNAYAMGQFQKRLDRLDRARKMSLEELDAATRVIIEEDDA